MSYDVHITRKHSWADPEGPEISLAEWHAVVRVDPEMEPDGCTEGRLDDRGVLRTEWVWAPYSQSDPSGREAWFVYQHGEVVVTNPDADIIRKMWSIAQALSAKVQGDDGEVYDSFARASRPEEHLPKKPWWRFW